MSIDPSDPTYILELSNGSGSIGNISSDLMKCLQFDYCLSIAIVVCMVSNFVGNTLALATFSRWSEVEGRSPPVYLFQEMAVCDMLVMLPVLFVTVYPSLCVVVTQYSGICKTYCQIYLPYMVKYLWPLSTIAQVSATWLTILKAFSRYQSVRRTTPRCTCKCNLSPMKAVHIQVAASWILSIIYNFPKFFEFEIIEVNTWDNQTINLYKNTDMANNTTYKVVYLFLSSLLLVNVIPAIVLTVLVVKLYRTLAHTHNEEERSFTIMMIIILISFLVTQGPASINRLLLTITNANTCGHFVFYLTRMCNFLGYVNCSTTIYIYVASNATFRMYLRSLFRRRRKRAGSGMHSGKHKNSFILTDHDSSLSSDPEVTLGIGNYRTYQEDNVAFNLGADDVDVDVRQVTSSEVYQNEAQVYTNGHGPSNGHANGHLSRSRSYILRGVSAELSNGEVRTENAHVNGHAVVYDTYM